MQRLWSVYCDFCILLSFSMLFCFGFFFFVTFVLICVYQDCGVMLSRLATGVVGNSLEYCGDNRVVIFENLLPSASFL